MDKSSAYAHIRQKHLSEFSIIAYDFDKPWGGYIAIDPKQIVLFRQSFFPDASIENDENLSPKLLIVEANKRLSWQYHHRRAELWKVVEGRVAIALSPTDEEFPPKVYMPGDLISIAQGERHRLIGLDERGVVAEIWRHVYREDMSDEADIVRVQDDFGR